MYERRQNLAFISLFVIAASTSGNHNNLYNTLVAARQVWNTFVVVVVFLYIPSRFIFVLHRRLLILLIRYVHKKCFYIFAIKATENNLKEEIKLFKICQIK